MNKIYRVIWNATLGTWVAVSETAKSKTKSKTKTVGAVLAVVSAISFSPVAMADGLDGGSTRSDCNSVNNIGTGTKANQSLAVGSYACAPGDQSVALGGNTYAKGNSSVAIGGDDLDRVARGTTGTFTGTNAAFNTTAVAKEFKNLTGQDLVDVAGGKQYISTEAGDASVAVGVMSSAKGALSLAFGTRSEANVNSATALGTGAIASKAGAIALGAGSLTDGTATKVEQATVNGVNFVGFNGSNAFSGVASDAGRQVSVGAIGNERQIKNVAPGALTATSTDAINGSQIYAVTSKLIDEIQTTKTVAPVVYTDTSGNKLTKAANGNWYTSTSVKSDGTLIGTPTAVAVGSVITSVQNANGSTTTPTKLTNIADGTIAANSKDAVNGGQLNTVKTIADTANTTANKGLNFRANAGASDNLALGDTLTLADGTNTTVVYDAATNTYKYSVVANPSFTSITTTGNANVGGNLVIGTGGTAATTTTLSSDGTSLSVGGDKITNIADGTIAANSKDAVNGGQLNTVKTTADNAQTAANTADGKAVAAQTTANTAVNNAATAQTAANTADGKAVAAQNTANTAVSNAATAQTAANTADGKAVAAQTTANTANTTANRGLNFRANAGASDNLALGDTLTLADGTNTTVVYDAATNTYKYSVVANPSFTSITTTGNANVGGNLVIGTGGTAATTTTLSSDGTSLNVGGDKITNVGAGAVSSTSTDAVNGSQLNTTNTNVTAAQTAANTADGKAVAAQNTANTAVSNAATAQTTADTANTTANKGINFGGTTGKNNFALGSDINVKGDSNLTSTTVAGGVQLGLGDTINVKDAINVGNGATKLQINGTSNTIGGLSNKTWTGTAVTGQAATEDQLKTVSDAQKATDNAAVKYDNATAKDQVTLGGVGATTPVALTNVKAGALNATSTDAVNGSQLYTTNQKVATNTANIATNTGDITTLKGGFNLQTNGASSGAIKAGDTVDIGVATPADTNLTATKTGNNVAFALSKDLTLTSVTAGNTVINNAGLSADKVTVGNIILDKTTNKISGVEAGTATKDAVNKGQLDALAAQQAATDNAAVKYDTAAKDQVTLGGAGAATPVALTNVKAGALNATSTDAVNGSQLYTTNQKVATNTANIAT
ncbi:beta strand repeat-containing protein, partial [Acinetobacter albensis]